MMDKLRALLSSWALIVPCILLGEVVLSELIISRVPYTEIDWKAYMDEVRPVVEHGELNYTKLRGETGPLVYPGGFVWLYSALYAATGGDVPLAQHAHVALYVAFLAVVAACFAYSKPRPGFAPLLLAVFCVSKRMHSLFVLRLFNDCPAMFLLWVAFYLFQRDRMFLGCLFFSASLSVKMNALLVVPGILLVVVVQRGWLRAALYGFLCAAFQVAVGLPFIMHDADAYWGQSFNFGRVFKRKWSVNFKWVPCTDLPPAEESLLEDCTGLFTSKEFGFGLLALHLFILAVFAWRWVGWVGGPLRVLPVFSKGSARFTPLQIMLILLTCNFVGVACARSLHFQFYVWYFHTTPFLLFALREVPVAVSVVLLLLIELCWNPWSGQSSTVESSMLITACHAIILLLLLFCSNHGDTTAEKKQKIA
eukprot:Rhum_TRINITY_DN9892_c0_g2::Rhum_TRINITY_DN9892_c0_g2_i1::g.35268::m.35268/K03845/ALG3; alpha-1,3-mannosyltransferase